MTTVAEMCGIPMTGPFLRPFLLHLRFLGFLVRICTAESLTFCRVAAAVRNVAYLI